MTSIPTHIEIKIQEAAETYGRVLELCCKQLVEPSDKILTEISVRIGTMAHSYRSALNNMMWDFAEKCLQDKLLETEYSEIRWSHDYPIEKDKGKFENSRTRILRHIRKHYPKVYRFVESTQPYHYEFSMLWTIKLLSNDSTHTIPVIVNEPNISAITLEHGDPRIFGDKVVIPMPSGNPAIFRTPCFIAPLDMFVSRDGKWKIYLIGIDQNPKYSVTSFIFNAYPLVRKIVVGFYRSLSEAV